MTKLRHIDQDGRARFITFSCHERLPLLTNDVFRSVLTRWMDAARMECGFKLLGYVIMPEHVHIVLWPLDDSRVGSIVGLIKQEAAREVFRILDDGSSTLLQRLQVSRGGVNKRVFWQRRCYDHNCRDDKSVCEKVEYCHRNPVTRGLVSDPSRWTYSSFNCYQGHRDVPLQMDEPNMFALSKPALRVGHDEVGDSDVSSV